MFINKYFLYSPVPDHGSRDRDVVLVRRGACWVNPKGARNLEWGGVEKGEISFRATWDQGGQDSFTPKEGFQVSKRGTEGKVTGISKGSKTKGLRHNLCCRMYMCI